MISSGKKGDEKRALEGFLSKSDQNREATQINRNQNIPHQSASDSKQQCRTKDSGRYPERVKKNIQINKPKPLYLLISIILKHNVLICEGKEQIETAVLEVKSKSWQLNSNTTKHNCAVLAVITQSWWKV